MTDGFSATTQLIHSMSELWVRHMRHAQENCDSSHELAEITEEADGLEQLLAASKIELETHAKTDASAAMTIILAYLNENEPHAAPFNITLATARPINYIIRSTCGITHDAARWLDDNFPEMTSLEWRPTGKQAV